MHESPLLVRQESDNSTAVYTSVSPQQAGWELLHFAARRLQPGQSWRANTEGNEWAFVLLGGNCTINSSKGNWDNAGRRPDVFSGMPYALYLPHHTEFEITAGADGLDLAYGWCPTDEDRAPQLITPDQIDVEIRGGANATRQINNIIPPGFDCQRLVVVEVYTPSGNWSSYPPHKHDEHREDEAGRLLEADLEEIYFYKLDKPHGYAFQRVYTGDGRLDELIMAQNNDLVLVPEGYHPVVSAHGYTTYYLNFLAGSAQSLANSDDPEHAWIKETWQEKDPRLPIVSMAMESQVE
ncbi:MAG TPA: 5-deoxy-glucuronate isomerase [Candidatus Sulfomarinibacteraceae bacterium]|nr:5-deoxy-glucuronate isomerase [Candidatus Sulfomarinibacteraceae bacterium]